jgi:predicted TIM-barrel fold metal-dependent hydrolase
MEHFVSEMDAAGVTHGVAWGRDVDDATESTDNDDLVRLIAEFPGRFTGFAGLYVRDDVQQSLAEVERVFELGLRGVALEPGVRVPPLRCDAGLLYPIYQKLTDLGGILALTVSTLTGYDQTYSDPDAVARVAADFPSLPIVVGHACWPWVTQSCAAAVRHSNIYLLPDCYGIRLPAHMEWVEAANTFLQDQMLYGSAYPAGSLEYFVAGYRALPYRPEVQQQVLYGNAARLLGLDAAVQ